VGPVDLMGHSRGWHISFRVAQRGPICCAGLILPSPAASSMQRSTRTTKAVPRRCWRVSRRGDKVAAGDVDAGSNSSSTRSRTRRWHGCRR